MLAFSKGGVGFEGFSRFGYKAIHRYVNQFTYRRNKCDISLSKLLATHKNVFTDIRVIHGV